MFPFAAFLRGIPLENFAVVATDLFQLHAHVDNNGVYAGVTIGSVNIIKLNRTGGVGGTHNADYIKGTGKDGSDVWVSRVINSTQGSGLSFDDIGAGRQPCTGSYRIHVHDTTDDGSASKADVTVTFWDAASGGSILDTANYDLSAERLGV